MFKFLTIYGPWGRPDMSLFKFTKAILNGKPIDVYNNGEMSQGLIYLDDLVNGMRLLMGIIPCQSDGTENKIDTFDSKSLVAQFWVVNIGHLRPEKLTDFIKATEKALGIDAIKNFMPMQTGDVPAIWADNFLLQVLTGFTTSTDFKDGIQKFLSWSHDYEDV